MARAIAKRTRDDPAVRRAQIIDETIRLIGQRGYWGLTLQDVAKACGISNAGVLYHFASKELLLIAAMQEYDQRESAIIAPLVEAATRRVGGRTAESRAAALELLRTIVLEGTSAPEFMRLYTALLSESLDADHPAHQSFRAREAKTLKLLSDVVRPYADDPKSTARQLYAVMDGLGQQWIRSGQSFDIVKEFARALELLVPQLTASSTKKAAPKKTRTAKR